MTDIITAMESLAECLCAQVQIDNPGSDLCFCGLVAGEGISVDTGSCANGCGMAYVRLTSVYSAAEVGVLSLEPGNCAVGEGFDVEVGIFRCYPIQADGSAPPPEDMLESTRQQVLDAQTMRCAIAACGWIPSKDYVIGQYVPSGPAGGVVGGVIPISAWVP